MKPDPQAAPTQAWRLLVDSGRTLSWTPSVLLVGLLVLAQGRDPATGSRDASAGAVGPVSARVPSVLPAPRAVFMHAAGGGRIDGTLARNVIENAPIIEGTPGHLVVDTTLRISPDLVREIARAPYVRDLSNEMERIVEEFKSALTALDANVDDVGYAGIGLGEGYIGVNINRRLYSVDGRNSILVNPYRIAEEIETWVRAGLTPTDARKEFSGRVVSAILHEIAHQSAREHDETFAAALTRLYGTSIATAHRSVRRLQEEIDETAYRRIVSDLTRLRSQWGGRDVLASSVPAALEGTDASGPSGRPAR